MQLYANQTPSKRKSLEELIEDKKADIEKFKLLIVKYIQQNPEKAAQKQESGEFDRKLAAKEEELAKFVILLNTRDQASIDQEQVVIAQQKAKEAEFEAKLQAARQQGYAEAQKEHMAENKVADKSTK